MSDSRKKARKSPSRVLRPILEGPLEERVLLARPSLQQYLAISKVILNKKKVGTAYVHNFPAFKSIGAPPFQSGLNRVIPAPAFRGLRGGQGVEVAATDGSHYRIELSYISNTVATSAGDGAAGIYTQSTPSPATTVIQPQSYPQPIGTVRAYPMSGGRVGIIVDGSTENTQLTINPLPRPIRKGYAHSYAYGMSSRTHVLNVGQITINSGRIGTVEGFHTTVLSGPLTATGTTTIDRIAFYSIVPGASIETGGTVNTLDVLQGITLNTGTNIQIGRDLNLLNAGQDITLSNGSKILIGRDLGLTLQPPKGTGTGTNVLTLNQNIVGTTSNQVTPPAVSTFIQGNLSVGPGSAFVIGRSVDNQVYIAGTLNGGSRVVIPSSSVPAGTPTLRALGGVIP